MSKHTLHTSGGPRLRTETKNYDVKGRNPLATVSKSHPKGGVASKKGNGFDRPLNDMSAPYGAYSVALRAYAKGEPVVSDKV